MSIIIDNTPEQPTTGDNEAAERRTYTVAEAAKILGIGRNTAYEACNAGEIPTIRLGGRILVPKAALDELLGGA